MLRTPFRATLFCTVVCLVNLAAVHVASATAIPSGFNLLHLPSGNATLTIPAVSAIPIQFQSRKLHPPTPILPADAIPPGLGNADTIIERTTGLPPGGTGVIQAEIIALSLVSVDPVSTPGGLFDVFIIWEDPSPFALGQIEVLTNISGTGTFDSSFPVFVDITLVESGNPLNQSQFPGLQAQMESSGTAWSHIPPPLYPSDPAFPSGAFFPEVTLGTPWTFNVSGDDMTGTMSFIHAAIPEPSTLTLAALGLVGLLGYGWPRPRRA